MLIFSVTPPARLRRGLVCCRLTKPGNISYLFSPPVAVATSTSWEDDGLECSSGMQIPSLGFAIGKRKHLQEQDVT